MLSQIEKKPGTECKRAPFGAPSGAVPKSGIFQKSEWCVTEWFRAVLALVPGFFRIFSKFCFDKVSKDPSFHDLVFHVKTTFFLQSMSQLLLGITLSSSAHHTVLYILTLFFNALQA